MTATVPDPRFRDQAEAAFGLIAHHVNPAIGWWRSADARGETFDRDLLGDRYRRAAEAVLELARAELARVQAAVNQRAAEAERRENDTIADTVLALADDYLTEHPDGIDTDEVYDWLVAQAAAIRTTS